MRVDMRRGDLQFASLFFHSPWLYTMHRCACVAAFTAALVVALPTHAQVQRNFPATALRGNAVFGQPPELLVNGTPMRLAPGARIRGTNNMLVMSGSLIGSKSTINYTVDGVGLVMDVWILTDEERAKKPWPITPQEAQSWQFDPVAQVWSKR
jgi:hypothetical protein